MNSQRPAVPFPESDAPKQWVQQWFIQDVTWRGYLAQFEKEQSPHIGAPYYDQDVPLRVITGQTKAPSEYTSADEAQWWSSLMGLQQAYRAALQRAQEAWAQEAWTKQMRKPASPVQGEPVGAPLEALGDTTSRLKDSRAVREIPPRVPHASVPFQESPVPHQAPPVGGKPVPSEEGHAPESTPPLHLLYNEMIFPQIQARAFQFFLGIFGSDPGLRADCAVEFLHAFPGCGAAQEAVLQEFATRVLGPIMLSMGILEVRAHPMRLELSSLPTREVQVKEVAIPLETEAQRLQWFLDRFCAQERFVVRDSLADQGVRDQTQAP